MSFKRDNKKTKNIFLITAIAIIAVASLFIGILPNKVETKTITKGYELNAKF